MYNVTLGRFCVTTVAVENNVLHILILCVCVYLALVIQHIKRMRSVSPVVCLAVPYSTTLSHKRHEFGQQFRMPTA
jgi:hypothetical protein